MKITKHCKIILALVMKGGGGGGGGGVKESKLYCI